MKKTLLLLSVFAGLSFGASAQCTPVYADSTHFTSSTDSYPDTVNAPENVALAAQVVSFKVPQDLPYNTGIALIGTIAVHIDSLRLDSITGLPAGVSLTGSPALGTWMHPNTWGCINFTGTPTGNQGDFNLTVTGTARFDTSITVPVLGTQTIDTTISHVPLSTVYPMTVKVTGTNGISQINADVNLNIFPNPNQGSFTVSVSSATRLEGTMTILDQLGRALTTQSLDVTGTKQIPVELGNIAPGAYLLEINSAGARSVKQFIVR